MGAFLFELRHRNKERFRPEYERRARGQKSEPWPVSNLIDPGSGGSCGGGEEVLSAVHLSRAIFSATNRNGKIVSWAVSELICSPGEQLEPDSQLISPLVMTASALVP